jgi:hypothetical protein
VGWASIGNFVSSKLTTSFTTLLNCDDLPEGSSDNDESAFLPEGSGTETSMAEESGGFLKPVLSG